MCRKDEYLLFKSRVTTSNHSNFVFRKTLTEKNASENVICFSRLLHMLTNVGLSKETNSVDPIGITSDISKHVGFCLFDLILYVHSTIFQLCGTGLPGLNQY